MIKNKNLFLILISLSTVILGTLAVVTAIKIYQLGKQPVAPNAPCSKPQAEGACSLTFTVAGPPTATPILPTVTPTQEVKPTATPTKEKTPTATPTRGVTATPTPTAVATATPTTPPSSTPIPTATGPTATPVYKTCFTSCDNDTQCESNLACLDYSGGKRCLNPSCQTEIDCGCNRCWQLCTNDWECQNDLNCLSVSGQKRCVNRNCSSEETCTCQGPTATPTPVGPTATPKPTQVAQATSVPTQPVTGIKTTTAFGILSGFFLISLGLALIF